ncbi:Hint domain-containing protein [Nioella ostreopsis]|uniref:Hint domain-containing protein n=1 Tax=Nioella ostreopsis TaxID=2448479 RepID=UPI000FDC1C07|nr:Hint domain-containing protein [Nioella ostreopsis]
MAAHTTLGWFQLGGVAVNGTLGGAGSSLTWTYALGWGNPDFDITDVDDSGTLNAGVDWWANNAITFTGYTITSGGTEYGVFSDGFTYRVPIHEDGDTQTTILASGTTNAYQSEATAYLCFAADSLIRTPGGEVRVDSLNIGDEVLTCDGKVVPVKWIGRQTAMPVFGLPDRLRLIRFAAGSLGEGLPTADLTVTADHGMLVGGVICHAGALVNGTTITQVPLQEMGESYTVYHIETEEHEIILANGAPAETFIDNVSRRVFDNYAEFEALYGDVPEMEELPHPRAMSERQVPERIKVSLSTRAAA